MWLKIFEDTLMLGLCFSISYWCFNHFVWWICLLLIIPIAIVSIIISVGITLLIKEKILKKKII